MKKINSFIENVSFRVLNKKWLNYSYQIARRIHAKLEDDHNLNQKKLAEMIGVSQQQVSKILKGKQNLTLQTIGKLSDAIGFELISFPAYKDDFIQLGDSVQFNEPLTLPENGRMEKNASKAQVKESNLIVIRGGSLAVA